ncbi:Signal peptidase I P [bioreactor metagenome]|uniref:signal peptidase I n=1 Tax=bioreactor metagenome TaxID=1076179 RepID=A0A645IHP0_9ZZZZ
MEPTLRTGDRVYYTGFTKLRFNDLVIFDAGSLYGRVVKRVAGLPGDTISISADGRLIRNHVLEEEPFILPDQLGNSGMQEITVAAGTVFVLGDNRAESIDSRDSRIGLIRQDAILGVVTNFIREIGG